jgi:hypothetical protein
LAKDDVIGGVDFEFEDALGAINENSFLLAIAIEDDGIGTHEVFHDGLAGWVLDGHGEVAWL